MTLNANHSIRSVTVDDWLPLAYLTVDEAHIHRHLDWRSLQDWIGSEPFLILENPQVPYSKTAAHNNGRYLGVLVCPPDPPYVAWIRFFGYDPAFIKPDIAWSFLWEKAAAMLKDKPELHCAAAVVMQDWFAKVLQNSGFKCTHSVVSLIYRQAESDNPPAKLNEKNIRPMLKKDLPAVAQLDNQAFSPLWHFTLPTLQLAFQYSAIATVWEENRQIIGYQISSVSNEGGHLSRLAVHPDYQGKRIGTKLVQDLIVRFAKRRIYTITVNTQNNNQASLAIYHRLGFTDMAENYPVYEYPL